MHDLTSDDDFLNYALDNYVYKESATKSIFLSDLRLINNFENYMNKHNKSSVLIQNQLTIIYNLFGEDASTKLLKYKLDNKFKKYTYNVP